MNINTAVLISGEMRSFARTFPNQYWFVYRKLRDPHFFIVVKDDAQAETIDLLRGTFGAERVHARVIADPVLAVSDKVARAWHDAPYANAAPAGQLMLQHWYQQEVWRDYFESGMAADVVIRIRPDQWFHSAPQAYAFNIGDMVCQVPWWGRFGGVNDRFALMGKHIAGHYFGVYGMLDDLLDAGCPFHPESLVRAAVERGNGIIVENLAAVFSTMRIDGSMRPPEIISVDIADRAAG